MADPKALTERRDPHPDERRAMAEACERRARRPALVEFASCQNNPRGTIEIAAPHKDFDGWIDQLTDALGTASAPFASVLVAQIAASLGDLSDVAKFNAALAMIQGIAPANEHQAMLAAQSVATHFLAMDTLGRASRSETVETRDSYVTMATKLTRTFAAQAEALAKLRGGGRQIIEYRHIYVTAENAVIGDNANAVFGAIQQGGTTRNVDQPHATSRTAALAYAPGVSMPGQDTARNGLSVAGGEGQEALPDARRKEPRRTDRSRQRPVSKRAPHPGTAPIPVDGSGVRQGGARPVR